MVYSKGGGNLVKIRLHLAILLSLFNFSILFRNGYSILQVAYKVSRLFEM